MFQTLFTGRNEVLAKVIFLQASVFLQGGGGSGPRGGLKFSGGGAGLQPEYGQRSAGTHPTGMHSFLFLYIILSISSFLMCIVKMLPFSQKYAYHVY